MKSERIFNALGEVDSALLKRCETAGSRRMVWIHRGAIAACLCLFLAAGFFLSLNNTRDRIIMPGTSEQIVESFSLDIDSMLGIYSTPSNGTVLIFNDVKSALEQNTGRNHTYFVAMDIYQDGVLLDPDSSAVKKELKRLKKQGYRVGYTDSWTYQSDMDQLNVIYTAGYFTKTQINKFTGNKDYGYSFYFAVNGDGSPVSSDHGLRKNP